MATCVALVVLFSDNLNVLFPHVGNVQLKIIAGFALTPLSFVPLRVLSFTSVLGILSTFSSKLFLGATLGAGAEVNRWR
jgi:vesicular inhibitory amino acid transporter